MIRVLRLLIAGVALFCALACVGGGVTRRVVIEGKMFPENIVFLLDVSSSMSWSMGKKTRAFYAHRELRRLAAQMSDDGRVLFAVFDNGYRESPEGWIKLPDADLTKSAVAWACGQPLGGGTKLVEAMAEILDKPDSPLGIIILTDAEPNGDFVKDFERIQISNGKRKSKATIGVVAVLATLDFYGAQCDAFAKMVAEDGNGAYLRVTVE